MSSAPLRRLAPHPTRARTRRFAAALAFALVASLGGGAQAGGIPGPPLDPAPARVGDFCLPRGDAMGSGAGFATALAAIAIALRRRGGR